MSSDYCINVTMIIFADFTVKNNNFSNYGMLAEATVTMVTLKKGN